PIPADTNSVEWPRLIRRLLARLEMKPGDIDWFFFTQIDVRSIHQTLDELALPHEKAHNVMDQYGYTGSACIPMSLADACRKHLLKKGQNVFLVGSGGGMSMAAVAMRWEFDT
ncbi:MAG: 3-oxoacyl-[acyl-carrier-protein] synthase III C-terminal domain-containing protein, partial [Bdellovibrionales bacterium]